MQTSTSISLKHAGMTLAVLAARVAAEVASAASTSLCPPRKYWHESQEKCLPCKQCHGTRQVVLRPCEPYRNTVCAPLDRLDIAWPQPPQQPPSPPHLPEDPALPAQPFTELEQLVLDWQVAALATAVIACLLLFAAVGIVALVHARQWRRRLARHRLDPALLTSGDNITLGFTESNQTPGQISEELSAQLSLMVPDSTLHSDADSCVYLEQLLVRKNTSLDSGGGRGDGGGGGGGGSGKRPRPGNVYSVQR